MERLKQNLVIAGALIVLGITGLFMNSAQVAAQNPHPGSAPVNIVSPLPLPVTGSLNVSGGSVEVSGTVNVRDVDKTVRTPFQTLLRTDLLSEDSFIVDPSKSLTIEFVTSECRIQAGVGQTNSAIEFALRTTVGPEALGHNFQATFSRFFNIGQLINTYYHSTDMTRIYADPGTEVSVGGVLQNFTCFVTLSGYTVPS